jgi:tetratricopeptide (TPR) repeat protein
MQLSMLYADNGEWQKALDASRRLVELRPQAEVSYLAMAAACQELKLYKEQIEACNRALRINPDSLPSLEGLAWALYHTEQFGEAVSVLTRALKMSPSVPYFHAWLAHAYAELGKLQEATREMNVLEKLDPQLVSGVRKVIQEKARIESGARPVE